MSTLLFQSMPNRNGGNSNNGVRSSKITRVLVRQNYNEKELFKTTMRSAQETKDQGLMDAVSGHISARPKSQENE